MLYKDWIVEWLEYHVKPNVKIRTYEKYKNDAKNHIIPKLGGYDMDMLSGNVLCHFTVDLTSEGLSANTVKGIIAVLSSSLKRAYALSFVKSEHTRAIIRPKGEERAIDALNRDEQRKLECELNTGKREWYFGIILTLYTGMRIGELLALTWSDVNVEEGTISITKSCHDRWGKDGYEKIIETPKTKTSKREIPIPQSLLPELEAHFCNRKSEYVVGTESQGISVRACQRHFSNLLARLGIRHQGFHCLRHTFATRALECGMDVKTLAELLGHKNPNVTLLRYAHSMTEHKRSMMNILGDLFSKG